MATGRFRLKFMFWLDVAKEDESRLAEQIEELKQHRSYSRTIRDGIRLIYDLRAGRTDVLFALFPWLKVELTPQPVAATESQLQLEIAQLRELILGQGSSVSLTPNSNSGPKPLAMPKIAMPAFDDDDDDDQDTIVLRKDTTTDVTANFLKSVFALSE
jgi:hypothetical protein